MWNVLEQDTLAASGRGFKNGLDEVKGNLVIGGCKKNTFFNLRSAINKKNIVQTNE